MKQIIALFLCGTLLALCVGCKGNVSQDDEPSIVTTTTAAQTSTVQRSTTATKSKTQAATTTVASTTVASTTVSSQATTVTTADTTVVTVTTTTTKPPAIPTVSATVSASVGTQPSKPFAYEYTTNQQHTAIPLEKRYYYSLLSDELKGYYRQIDQAVRNLEAKVEFQNMPLDVDGCWGLYQLYMLDTPELIYLDTSAQTICLHDPENGSRVVSGMAFSYIVMQGKTAQRVFGDQITTAVRTAIRNRQATFDKAVSSIAATIPACAPDAAKQRMIYDYLIKNSSYNIDLLQGKPSAVGGEDNWTAYGVLFHKTGVCESYSEAFQVLCHAVGIRCIGITGTANGGNHKWNAVQLDNEWYMCDITFDDPVGGDPKAAYHVYFNLTSKQLAELNHTWSTDSLISAYPALKVPTCNGTRYSWQNFIELYGE